MGLKFYQIIVLGSFLRKQMLVWGLNLLYDTNIIFAELFSKSSLVYWSKESFIYMNSVIFTLCQID